MRSRGWARIRGRRWPSRLLAVAFFAAVVAAVAVVVEVDTRKLSTVASDLTLSPGTANAATTRGSDTLSAQALKESVTFQWVGDIAMSTQSGLPHGGVQGALAAVRGYLDWANVTTGNLEGTLSVGGVAKCGSRVTGTDCYSFQAPPSYAAGLRTLGFRVMNQANNHSNDFGQSGRDQTVHALHHAGMLETGYPGQISYLRVKGVRVAFLGFAPWPYDASLLDIPAARALVTTAKRHAAIIVVFVHDGAEGAGHTHTPVGSESFLGEDRGDVRAFAHAVINAGASVVFGSGPHVIRGVEDYRGHLIAYSAGNFEGQHTLAGGGVLNDSAIVRVRLSRTGTLLAARWVPITLVGGLPHFDRSGASVKLMRTLSAEDFPHDHFTVTPSGQFDLTTRAARS